MITCDTLLIVRSLRSLKRDWFKLARYLDDTVLADLVLDADKVGVVRRNYIAEVTD